MGAESSKPSYPYISSPRRDRYKSSSQLFSPAGIEQLTDESSQENSGIFVYVITGVCVFIGLMFLVYLAKFVLLKCLRKYRSAASKENSQTDYPEVSNSKLVGSIVIFY